MGWEQERKLSLSRTDMKVNRSYKDSFLLGFFFVCLCSTNHWLHILQDLKRMESRGKREREREMSSSRICVQILYRSWKTRDAVQA